MVLVTEKPAKVRPRTPRLVVLMAVVAVIAVPVLLFPYLSLEPDRSRISVTTDLHYVGLVVHVFTAATALLLGVLQLVPRVRARRVLPAGSVGHSLSSAWWRSGSPGSRWR